MNAAFNNRSCGGKGIGAASSFRDASVTDGEIEADLIAECSVGTEEVDGFKDDVNLSSWDIIRS